MENVIEKLKKFRVIIIIAVLLISGLIIWLVLRAADKKNIKPEEITPETRKGYFTDSDYPVYIGNADGKLIVDLDGSKTKDLRWTATVSDGNNVTVENGGEESEGRLSTVITPVIVGYATVTFTRDGELMGTSYTAAKIDVDVICTKNNEGIYSAKVSNVRQALTDIGAADTENPYIIEKNKVLFLNGGDWTLEPEDPDKIPEGLYEIFKEYNVDNSALSYLVLFNPDVLMTEDDELNMDVLNSVLVLKSESLGIEKKLKCVVNDKKEWILTSAEEQQNASE